jgi:hypothetical protein
VKLGVCSEQLTVPVEEAFAVIDGVGTLRESEGEMLSVAVHDVDLVASPFVSVTADLERETVMVFDLWPDREREGVPNVLDAVNVNDHDALSVLDWCAVADQAEIVRELETVYDFGISSVWLVDAVAVPIAESEYEMVRDADSRVIVDALKEKLFDLDADGDPVKSPFVAVFTVMERLSEIVLESRCDGDTEKEPTVIERVKL